MAALVWDEQAQAWKEAETPLAYDPASDAFVETAGLVWDAEAKAWTESWGGQAVRAYVYGAVEETVTIKKDGIVVATVSTNADGRSDEKIGLDHGTYTLTGSVSGWTEEQTVDKDTTLLRAMPSGLVIYWYGWEPSEGIRLLDYTIGLNIYKKGYLTKNKNDFVLSYIGECINLRSTNEKIDFSKYDYINFIGYTNRKDVVIQSTETITDPAKATGDDFSVTLEVSTTDKRYTLDIRNKTWMRYCSVRSTHTGTTIAKALWVK